MATTLQFLWEIVTVGPDAFDSAENLFRTADSAAVKSAADALDNIPGGSGLAAFVRSDPIAREWAWFKRILADIILILILSIGTLLVLYFLS